MGPVVVVVLKEASQQGSGTCCGRSFKSQLGIRGLFTLLNGLYSWLLVPYQLYLSFIVLLEMFWTNDFVVTSTYSANHAGVFLVLKLRPLSVKTQPVVFVSVLKRTYTDCYHI